MGGVHHRLAGRSGGRLVAQVLKDGGWQVWWGEGWAFVVIIRRSWTIQKL